MSRPRGYKVTHRVSRQVDRVMADGKPYVFVRCTCGQPCDGVTLAGARDAYEAHLDRCEANGRAVERPMWDDLPVMR